MSVVLVVLQCLIGVVMAIWLVRWARRRGRPASKFEEVADRWSLIGIAAYSAIVGLVALGYGAHIARHPGFKIGYIFIAAAIIVLPLGIRRVRDR